MQACAVTSRLWLIIFACCGCANLFGEAFGLDGLAILSKPLLMPLLGVFAYHKAKEMGVALPKALIAALVFCWLGDVILMTGAFVFGLIAFLIGHCFYIALNLGGRPQLRTDIGALLATFVLVSTAGFVLQGVNTRSPDMVLPVAFYAGILCALFYTGLMAQTTSPSKWGVTLMIGICLFIVSDTMIGINRFVSTFDASGFLIMATYSVAQYLLVSANLAKRDPNLG